MHDPIDPNVQRRPKYKCHSRKFQVKNRKKKGLNNAFYILRSVCRALLRLLLENLNDEVGATRALVFGVLTEMLKQELLISSFQGFTELIILKVLESHRDAEKDVRVFFCTHLSASFNKITDVQSETGRKSG